MAAWALVASGCLIPEGTADFALCCTCLDQKSPQTADADAVDDSANCLPDTAEGSGAAEVDGCNEQAAAQAASLQDGTAAAAAPILIVDESCTVTTCQDACRGALLRGATFEVREESLSD